MKKRTVFFVILIIASILVIWYVRARGDDPVTVQAVQVAGGTYEETISGIGFVRYDKEQDIQSDNGGRISEVNPEAGTLVKTGEILVRLEEDEIVERMDELQRERNRLEAARKDYNTSYQRSRKQTDAQKLVYDEEIESIRLRLANLNPDIQRTQNLVEADIAPSNELQKLLDLQEELNRSITLVEVKRNSLVYPAYTDEELMSALEAVDGRIADEQRKLEENEVRAPYDGIILEIFVKEGDIISKGQPVMTIASEERKLVTVAVDEQYISRLLPGKNAELFPDAISGESIRGRIVARSPVVDLETGTIDIDVEIMEAKDRFLKNMTVRVDLEAVTFEDALILSGDYLSGDQEPVVLMENEGRVVERKVEVYNRNLAYVMITEGLSVGDYVLNPEGLVAGMEVILEVGE